MEIVNLERRLICRGNRFRKELGDLEDMTESIRDKGIIQPITVMKRDDAPMINGEVMQPYILVAGERRYMCAVELEMDTIPCIIREIEDDLDFREIELFENVFRKEMEWNETIKLVKEIQNLQEKKFSGTPWKWSQRKCGKLLGISKSEVQRKIAMADAIEAIPALAECKDEATARKLLAKMEEKLETKIAVKEQQERVNNDPSLLAYEASYQIGDAFAGLAATIESNIDVQFLEVDPPYGIDLQEQKSREDSDNDYDITAYNEVERDEYSKFLNKLCPLLFACLGETGGWCIFWFGPTWHTQVYTALKGAGFIIDDIPAIWAKGQGQTAAPNYNLGRAYEPFFICRRGSGQLKSKGRPNVFTFKPVNPTYKYHPTERPLKLMDDLFATFGAEGGTCVIPFLGSGVSLLAARRRGMLAFGWDLSNEYRERFLLRAEREDE